MGIIETKDIRGGTIVEIQARINPSGAVLSDVSHLSATLQLANPTLNCSLIGCTRSLSAILERDTSSTPAPYYDGEYNVRP